MANPEPLWLSFFPLCLPWLEPFSPAAPCFTHHPPPFLHSFHLGYGSHLHPPWLPLPFPLPLLAACQLNHVHPFPCPFPFPFPCQFAPPSPFPLAALLVGFHSFVGDDAAVCPVADCTTRASSIMSFLIASPCAKRRGMIDWLSSVSGAFFNHLFSNHQHSMRGVFNHNIHQTTSQ